MSDESFDINSLQINPTALEGLTVVITGKMTKIVNRKEIEALVEKAGWPATGSISSKTNLLVAGDKAGSKLQKAKKLGIEILNEEEFLNGITSQVNKADEAVDVRSNGISFKGTIDEFIKYCSTQGRAEYHIDDVPITDLKTIKVYYLSNYSGIYVIILLKRFKD